MISGVIIWAFEVGAKISASVYCTIFEVNAEHMDNYPHVLEARYPAIIIMMILTIILPNNESILHLANVFRRAHIKSLLKQSERSSYLKKAISEDL